MKKYITIPLLLIVLTMLLVSCGSTKPVMVTNETTTTKTVTERVHDTVFKIEKDSSYYEAYLECIEGKVVVKEVTKSEPGRNLKSPKVRIDNNKLQVDCEAQAYEKYLTWVSKYVEEHKDKTIQVPIVTNELTWWQQTQIKLFRILAIIVLLFIVWQILKKNLRI